LPEAPLPMASMQTAMPYSRGLNGFTPRIEWFMGYSYLRAVPELAEGNRLVYLNGGSTSVALNFNRYFGIVGDFGGFNDTRLLLTGAGLSANDQIDKGTVFTYLGGPRLSFRHDRVTPFVQVLAGGVHASEISRLHAVTQRQRLCHDGRRRSGCKDSSSPCAAFDPGRIHDDAV